MTTNPIMMENLKGSKQLVDLWTMDACLELSQFQGQLEIGNIKTLRCKMHSKKNPQ